MKSILAVIFLLGSAAYGQTAQVIELSHPDSLEAQVKYETLKHAQEDWDNFQDQVRQAYLTNHKGCPIVIFNSSGQSEWPCSLAGFENGFEFSKDFKFLVTKPQVITPTCIYTNTPWNTLTPAYNAVPINDSPMIIHPKDNVVYK